MREQACGRSLKNQGFTHGVFHYYFRDKVDLICCSVRHYKSKCITRYDEVTASARTRAELMEGFLSKLGETVREDAAMHRLWYDLRSQALFEPSFRSDVLEIDKNLEIMVWRITSRYAELGGTRPAISPEALYAVFDGLFQKYLLRHLSDDRKSHPRLACKYQAVAADHHLTKERSRRPVAGPRLCLCLSGCRVRNARAKARAA